MRCTTLGAAVAIAFFILFCLASGTVAPPTVQENRLRDMYLMGSIYVPFIPLNDMTVALNDNSNFERLVKDGHGRAALTLFKGFLNQNRNLPMQEAVAFLQLDLCTGQAGFKKLSDMDGVIHVLPWGPEEVMAIAEFCHHSMNGLHRYVMTRVAIAGGDKRMTIEKAWGAVGELAEDPHIPPEKVVLLMTSFRRMLAQRTEEWTELKESGKDATVALAIGKFQADYDKSLRRTQAKLGKSVSVEDLPNLHGALSEDSKKIGELKREWNEAVLKIAPRSEKVAVPAAQSTGPSGVTTQSPSKE